MSVRKHKRDESFYHRWFLRIHVNTMFASSLVYEKKCAFASEEQKHNSEREYH